jgi:DNA-binding transcriptional MerR regulator
MTFSLSTTVISDQGEQLYTFESAASIAQTSIVVIQAYVQLGIIESIESRIHSREIARIAQIQRLRRDLGLNLVGAAMVLDLAHEIAQLRSQLDVYRSGSPNLF